MLIGWAWVLFFHTVMQQSLWKVIHHQIVSWTVENPTDYGHQVLQTSSPMHQIFLESTGPGGWYWTAMPFLNLYRSVGYTELFWWTWKYRIIHIDILKIWAHLRHLLVVYLVIMFTFNIISCIKNQNIISVDQSVHFRFESASHFFLFVGICQERN